VNSEKNKKQNKTISGYLKPHFLLSKPNIFFCQILLTMSQG